MYVVCSDRVQDKTVDPGDSDAVESQFVSELLKFKMDFKDVKTCHVTRVYSTLETPCHLLAVILNLKMKVGSHHVLPVTRLHFMGYKPYF